MFAKSTYCIQYAQFIHTSMWKYMFIHMWIYGMPAIMTWSRRTPLHSATGLPVIPRQTLGLARLSKPRRPSHRGRSAEPGTRDSERVQCCGQCRCPARAQIAGNGTDTGPQHQPRRRRSRRLMMPAPPA